MVGIGEGGAAEPLGRDLWGAIPARWRGRGGSGARGPVDAWLSRALPAGGQVSVGSSARLSSKAE